MAYDLLGRMIRRTEAEGTSTWIYDRQWIGALASETNGIASKAYIYDTLGRVKSVTTTVNGQAYTMGTTYDAFGRVSTITYPTGLRVQRNYNASGYLQSVSNAASGAVIWQANSMDAFGHLTGERFGNGVTTTHIYDNVRGVLTGLQSTSGGALIQDWTYDYDALGNMLFRRDNVAGYTERFGYDSLNRVTEVRDGAGVLQKSYAYDALGNITFKSGVGSYTYDPFHPHAVLTAGNNSYAYDANGNMTGGAGRSITWTSFNKPSGISTANGYTGFSYDANHKPGAEDYADEHNGVRRQGV
jgi:YD repeat-containing protein